MSRNRMCQSRGAVAIVIVVVVIGEPLEEVHAGHDDFIRSERVGDLVKLLDVVVVLGAHPSKKSTSDFGLDLKEAKNDG